MEPLEPGVVRRTTRRSSKTLSCTDSLHESVMDRDIHNSGADRLTSLWTDAEAHEPKQFPREIVGKKQDAPFEALNCYAAVNKPLLYITNVRVTLKSPEYTIEVTFIRSVINIVLFPHWPASCGHRPAE